MFHNVNRLRLKNEIFCRCYEIHGPLRRDN